MNTVVPTIAAEVKTSTTAPIWGTPELFFTYPEIEADGAESAGNVINRTASKPNLRVISTTFELRGVPNSYSTANFAVGEMVCLESKSLTLIVTW